MSIPQFPAYISHRLSEHLHEKEKKTQIAICFITLLMTVLSAHGAGEKSSVVPMLSPLLLGSSLKITTPTAPYLMVFNTCDTAQTDSCSDPSSHMFYLATSEDGVKWDLLPDWPATSGSVPDIIRRDDTLYIYTAGNGSNLIRFHLDTNKVEAPTSINISNSGSNVNFVDPTLIVDDNGDLVIFFLFSESNGDPATCPEGESTCTKLIGSATEVEGSDGTEFTLNTGERITVTVDSTSEYKAASDPDIFYDGSNYLIYLSRGSSVSAWVSRTLHGTYALIPTHPDDLLLDRTGGVPAGFYDSSKSQYWTYAHITQGDVTVIRHAVHDDFDEELLESELSTVISGTSLGLGASISVSSPGFTKNK